MNIEQEIQAKALLITLLILIYSVVEKSLPAFDPGIHAYIGIGWLARIGRELR